MSKRNRQRGKSYERWLANDLDGRRVGLLGMEDVLAGKYAIEAKEREKLPKFLTNTMEQAERNCPQGKTAVVCLHKNAGNHDDDMVVMRYKDWRGLV